MKSTRCSLGGWRNGQGHLFATKLLAPAPDRPQDRVDLHALTPHLLPDERQRAREAMARIEAIGANRSKPLGEELERWLSGREG